MTFRLLPKDVTFFDLFVADGENLQAAATRLHEMVSTYDRLDERVAEIQRLEKRGDEIDREITQRLEDAFITPFDREDIHELTVQLDDVVDGIQAVAETFVIYDIERADRRGSRAHPDPRRPGRSSSSRRCASSMGSRTSSPPRAGPRPRARGRRAVAGGGRRGCSATGRTRSRSSSGATSTASSRTRSMPPRTRPRRSSGCSTRRPEDASGRLAIQRSSARSRPAIAVAELEPAQGVGEADRARVVAAVRRRIDRWNASRPNEAASACRVRSGASWARTSSTSRRNDGCAQRSDRRAGSRRRRRSRRASSASARRAPAPEREQGGHPRGGGPRDGGAAVPIAVRRRGAGCRRGAVAVPSVGLGLAGHDRHGRMVAAAVSTPGHRGGQRCVPARPVRPGGGTRSRRRGPCG